jgi:hypothetical protein
MELIAPLQVPFKVKGVEIGQYPDLECKLIFDDCGDLIQVLAEHVDDPIESDAKDVNAKAIWDEALKQSKTTKMIIEIEAQMIASGWNLRSKRAA